MKTTKKTSRLLATIVSRARMMTLPKILVAGVLCWTTACFADPAEPAAGRIVDQGGFVDIDLPITEVHEDSGLTRVIASGNLEGTPAGFAIDFPSNSTRSSGPVPLTSDSAQIRSIGAASDSFVTLLARQYKLRAPRTTMIPIVEASVVALEGDPAHVSRGITKMKFFFFADGPEERYAEVFINVNTKNHLLEFREKDQDYRQPLLLAFTQGR